MAQVLEGIGSVIEAGTGAAGLVQGAHENAVQYRQDAHVGADARRQNERLLNGPGEFPGYSENVQGYTSPHGELYGSTPQFSEGAPQQGNLPPNTQVSTMPVNDRPAAILNPNGTVSYPGMVESVGNAVMPQRGFDVGGAMGGQPLYMQGEPVYLQPTGYASPFGSPPVFFTDSSAPAASVMQSGVLNRRR